MKRQFHFSTLFTTHIVCASFAAFLAATFPAMAKTPILFLHGWQAESVGNHAAIWDPMKSLLREKNGYSEDELWALDYWEGMDVPIERYAARVAQEIVSSGKTVDIVAHSMGGLIVREILRSQPAAAAKIHRVVTLGTPHYGQNQEFGDTAEQMRYGSSYLYGLAKDWLSRKTTWSGRFLCIAGDSGDAHDGLVNCWSATLDGVAARYVRRVHSSFQSGAPVIHACVDGENDPVYRAVAAFLEYGNVLPTGTSGFVSAPARGGSIFFQVVDNNGNPVSYGGTWSRSEQNFVVEISPESGNGFMEHHGEYGAGTAGGKNSNLQGIGQLTGSNGTTYDGLSAGTYALSFSSSNDGKVGPFTFEGIKVENNKTTVVQIPASAGQDVVIVIDSTGSMSSAIASAKSSAANIASKILGNSSTTGAFRRNRVSVVEYRDKGDSFVCRAKAKFTSDISTVILAINGITVGGGGDAPEALYATLHAIADGLAGEWRNPDRHIIVMTDAPAHDPDLVTGDTLSTVTRILNNVGAVVTSETFASKGKDAVSQNGVHVDMVYLGSNPSASTTYGKLSEDTGGTCQIGVDPSYAGEAILDVIETVSGISYYVDAATGNDMNDGKSWTYAKKTIQAAIDAADNGARILVKDGVYGPISTVDVTSYPDGKAVEILSVNGAATTIIDGGGVNRAASLGSHDIYTGDPVGLQAVLEGFTIRNGGYTDSTDDMPGSGVLGGILRNCVITANRSRVSGGGAACATLENCRIFGNRSEVNGGGTFACDLVDCLVENNVAANNGGGTAGGRLKRCIVRNNSAKYGGGHQGGDAEDSLFTGNSTTLGGGAVAGANLSRCTVVNNQTDGIGGGAIGSVLHGSIVWDNTALTLDDNCNTSHGFYNDTAPRLPGRGNISANPIFRNASAGDYRLSASSPCVDTGFGPTDTARKDLAGEQRWQGVRIDIGAYEFANSFTPIFVPGDFWVDAKNGSDARSGTSRDEALATIDAAIAKAADGAIIHVLPGTYSPFTLDARTLTIQSTDGAGQTIINGFGLAPCVWNGTDSQSSLEGFTLCNGYAPMDGGGVWGGTLRDCIIRDNTAGNFGGGAVLARLERCVIKGNSAPEGCGGGAFYCDLSNCLVYRNSAIEGGGVWAGGHYVVNCTIADNAASRTGGGIMSAGYVTNCIVWGNSAPTSPNIYGCDEWHLCSPVVDPGCGSIASAPLFVDAANGDYRLQPGSPCIDAGTNAGIDDGDADLAGNPRKLGPAVDIGCLEFLKDNGELAGLFWSFDGAVLTISGNGEMADYDPDDPESCPYKAYADSITAIVVEEGVSYIGERAFSMLPNVAEVTLPNSLTGIGAEAFLGCGEGIFDSSTIPGVDLVDGWAVSSDEAISGDLDLTGIRGIADSAFSGCPSLTSVTIPDGVLGVGVLAFQGCGALTSVAIPNSVTSIGEYAFTGCPNLRTAYIPSRFIGHEALLGIPRTCQTIRRDIYDFVCRLYALCLGRNPDKTGCEHWTTLLASGARNGASVAYGFCLSAEMKRRNLSDAAYVEILYNALMDRQPDPSGKAHWVDLLNKGISRVGVFRGFAESAEFTRICNAYGIVRGNVDTKLLEERDKNRGVTMFVGRCYTKALNRNYDVNGLNHWCAKINSASNKKAMAIQVSKSFLTSAEFQRRNLSNPAFVDVLYQTFLDRNADAAGRKHWVDKLNAGFSRNTVMAGFYNSAEFSRLMASYGIK